MLKIGIIGGTGLDDPKLLRDYENIEVNTEYGLPSSLITTGTIKRVPVAILARHGKSHTIWPTGVNFRANIMALKKLGCTHILATTACGSLRNRIKPGDFVFPDQFIDFTRKRDLTFFEDFSKEIKHIPMAVPFCTVLRKLLHITSKKLKIHSHATGTVVTIEGPRFSSRAESERFRLIGGDIINMSTVPEVVLAREAQIHYAVIAMSTDYDCWKDDEEPVSWSVIVKRMKQNASNVKKLMVETVPLIYKLNCNLCTS